jgi:hypothetical protein
VSTCEDATPLGSIGAIDITIVMPNTVCSHAEGSPQGFPFLILPRVLFMLPDSSNLRGVVGGGNRPGSSSSVDSGA